MGSVTRLRTALFAGLLAGAAATTAQAGGFAIVTNGNDAGPGSLRHALEVREANFVFIPRRVGAINIDSTLEYSAESPLAIFGSGQAVATLANTDILAVTAGADLTVSNLDFRGPGGFSILNRGDQNGPAGKGIFVDVRDDQVGTVRVKLFRVGVSGVANHGVHVSDCSLADDCGGGSGGGGEGSPASIEVTCVACTIDDVGNGKFDADGLRVDDRGAGSIYALFRHSSFTNVGADGVELDEGNDGDVWATSLDTQYLANGRYCDPALLEDFLPAEDEGEFDESEQVTEDQIPGPIVGSPDDSCFEREVDLYDSGFVEEYEFGIDVDDGIDLDEAGAGSLWAGLRRSRIDDNLDEGVDLDEEDEGDVIISYVATTASGNADDAYKVSEEDGGSVWGSVRRSSATDNGGKGFVFEEENDGDLFVNVVRSTATGNDDSDETGIEAVQDDDGEGKLRVRASSIADGLDLDGVDEI